MSNGSQINYKQKYEELKMKFMESVDSAFRLGFEQGAQQAAQDQMMMQQQQQMQMQQQAAQGSPDFSGGGAEGSQPGTEQQMNPGSGQIGQPDSENPAGSELDQQIAKLESMLKSDSPKEMTDMLASLKSIKTKITFEHEMKKSSMAIPAISRALHKPAFKMGQNAQHNMSNSAKAAVTTQHQIVTDMMKAWNEEENKAASNINAVLNIENLTKSTK